MTKIYVYTDTHFYHNPMNEFRGENYEKKIISALRNIPKCDMFIHLGDVSLGNSEEDTLANELIINSVNANSKILVLGNHDKRSMSWYLNRGWSVALKSMIVEECGKNILFSHIPIVCPEWVDINIHGHLHGGEHREDEAISDNKHFLISLEMRGFVARYLNNVIESFNNNVYVG